MSNGSENSIKEELTRYLSIKSCYAPVFFNEDRSLAFISDLTGVPLIWAVDIGRNDWPYQLTFGDDRVSLLKPSNSGKMLAYSSDVGGNERFQISTLTQGGRVHRRLTSEPDVIHNLGCWSHDDSYIAYTSNERDRRFYDLYIIEVENAARNLILTQDGNNYALDWSGDGKTLLCLRTEAPFNQNLYLVNVSNGEVTELLPHEENAVFSPAQFNKSDGAIYLVTDLDRDKPQLARLRPGSHELEFLTNFDSEVEDMTLSNDGSRVCLSVNRDGYSELWIMETKSLEKRRLDPPSGVLGSFAWSSSGEKLAFTVSGSRFNADIWVYRFDTNTFTRVTHSSTAGVDPDSFVEPELIRTSSFDGTIIPSFVYRPNGRVGPSPTVFYIHGGPESQFRPSFNQLVQFMVNQGLTVVAPNFRGSTGYGRKFTHLDDVYNRMDTVKDVLAVAEHTKKLGISDPNHMALYGGSYGGFMVLACMYQSPDTWTAGVDVVGIANFVTFLKNTGPWRRKLRIAEYGDPERDAEFLAGISPVTNAHKIKAPLFVIHGKNDPRVPLNETEQIVNTLKGQNKEVHFMVFDDEGHGLVKLKNRIQGYSASMTFLIQHLM
jgi:dipeptidyl aminopeptidase/acylaminoacyl peptidase